MITRSGRSVVGGLVVVLAACSSIPGVTETTGSVGSTGASPDSTVAPTESTVASPVSTVAPDQAASFPIAAFAAIREHPVTEESAEEFQTALNEMVREGGKSATVMTAEGTWSGTAGKADGVRELRVDDQFSIASITKSVVAAQVMLMVEAGELALDDLAEEHLPAGLDFNTNQATIRNLLSHRSGLPDHWPVVLDLLSDDLLRVWTPAELLELVPSRRGTAGSSYEYGDTNYLLLGLVIEQVRGRPLAGVLRDGALAIDGVERLVYQPDEKPTEPMAMPGGESTEVLELGGGYLPALANVTAGGPADALASDSPSVARWFRALCAGEIVSQASLAEMSTAVGADPGHEYGLGLFNVAGPYGPSVGHAGWDTGFSSWAACLPDEGAVVVVLANSEIDDIRGMARPLVDVLRSD